MRAAPHPTPTPEEEALLGGPRLVLLSIEGRGGNGCREQDLLQKL